MESRAFIVGLIVGILATVTMDVVAVIALRFGIAGWGPRRTGPDLIACLKERLRPAAFPANCLYGGRNRLQVAV
jgi:hypothetical protein